MSKFSSRTQVCVEAKRALFDAMQNNVAVAGVIRHLDQAGFLIVPKPYQKPARRGNAKPAPYTGPTMIGKSHSERFVVPPSRPATNVAVEREGDPAAGTVVRHPVAAAVVEAGKVSP